MNGCGWVPIKLCLQKETEGQSQSQAGLDSQAVFNQLLSSKKKKKKKKKEQKNVILVKLNELKLT